MDSAGTVLVQPVYDEVRVFHEHRAAVKKNGKWGYIDQQGKECVPCDYTDVQEYFWFGHGAVHTSGGWRIVDSTGRYVSDYFFTSVTYHFPSFTGGTWNGKMRFIDRDGKLLFPGMFDSSAAVFVSSADSLIPVQQNGVWGYIDRSGQWAVAPQFEEAGSFYGSWAEVRVNGRSGIIALNGQFIVKPNYETCSWLYPSGLVRVRNDDQLTYTLVDTAGRQILPSGVTRFYYFPEDHMIWAVVDDRWVLYDESGTQRAITGYFWGEPVGELLPCFTEIPDDKSGEHPLGYFNRTGRLVWRPIK